MSAEVFRLDDGAGLQLAVSNYGARWLSARLDGRELLLGHATLADHAVQGGYLGAVCGRYANRIANSRFDLAGTTHRVQANEGAHCLHGGAEGFHRRLWTVHAADRRALRLRLHSPDGDQGFPGDLTVDLEYRIDAPGTLTLAWTLQCGRPCPVNLTSHAYFNLDGDAGSVAGHTLQVPADRVVPVDAAALPCGEPMPVTGTRYDLRTLQPALGRDGEGFDHCFVLPPGTPLTLQSADRRVRLRLASSLPGVQVYSGRHLPEASGRDGRPFAPFAGMALEPQFWPDSPNHPQWPQALVRPGQRVMHQIRYRFERVPA